MEKVNRLVVTLNASGQNKKVGELVLDGQAIRFQYYPGFLGQRINISPFKLPLNAEIQTPSTGVFGGLFGVFDDSLPDGWGRLLIDRQLNSRGENLGRISALDRLSMVGKAGMGALRYAPVSSDYSYAEHDIQLDQIALEAGKILEGESSLLIEELVHLGGSSGGARPKILVGYDPAKDQIIQNAAVLPAGYEHWMIKFPASLDSPDAALVEYAYYQMALAAGLEMAKCKLFKGQSGHYYFGTKRFDRIGNERLHLHSAAGLLHDNFRLSGMDYGHLMDAAFRLEKSRSAYEKILRLAAFNVFSHNRDDHSKNVSFLMDGSGNWSLAPAYDLTFSQSSHGQHSMTIAGEGQNPGEPHLLELAKTFSIKKPQLIIDEVQTAIAKWPVIAKELDIKPQTIQLIAKDVQKVP